MKSRDFINSRLEGFFAYLKAIGIQPSMFRTDQLMTLALIAEYSRYQAMMAAFQKAQEEAKREREAKLENVMFTIVFENGGSAQASVKLDPETGELVNVGNMDEDIRKPVERYITRKDGTKLPVVFEDGKYRVPFEDVRFVSVWDGGVTVETAAKLNLITSEVVDIETADNVHGLEVLEEEYVLRSDGTKLSVVQNEDGRYFVKLSPSEEAQLNETKTAAEETVEDPVR